MELVIAWGHHVRQPPRHVLHFGEELRRPPAPQILQAVQQEGTRACQKVGVGPGMRRVNALLLAGPT
jgi:hypothetical protein